MPMPSLRVKGLLERVPTHALCYLRKAARSTKHWVNLHFAVAKVGVLIEIFEISASVNNGVTTVLRCKDSGLKVTGGAFMTLRTS
jgi:hypothetical protein